MNKFDEPVVNNAGDPFGSRSAFFSNTTHDEERKLVQWYAEHVLCTKERLWGYCATGSTEAILCGLWMARKSMSEGAIIFASEECHFSVPKTADILGLTFVPVRTTDDGGMCMRELQRLVQESNRDAIIVLTMGSTVRNAYDDVNAFRKLKFSKRTHVHVDAAFGGAVYPFTNPEMLALHFDTYNVSLHKFWGAHRPCAIFLCTKKLQRCVDGVGCYGKEMVYLASTDHTVSCSRDGAIIKTMLEYLSRRGFAARNTHEIRKCLALRDRYVEKFRTLLGDDRVRVANDALSMSFTLHDLPMDAEHLMRQYSMSVRPRPCRKRFDTHVYLCSHVSSDMLDDLLRTLSPYMVNDLAASESGGCVIA